MPTHKECINFNNGYCKLFNIPVDPDGPACPNFQPRSSATGQAATPGEYSGLVGHSPILRYALPPRQRRARRRLRHRRGRLLTDL